MYTLLSPCLYILQYIVQTAQCSNKRLCPRSCCVNLLFRLDGANWGRVFTPLCIPHSGRPNCVTNTTTTIPKKGSSICSISSAQPVNQPHGKSIRQPFNMFYTIHNILNIIHNTHTSTFTILPPPTFFKFLFNSQLCIQYVYWKWRIIKVMFKITIFGSTFVVIWNSVYSYLNALFLGLNISL